MALAVFVRRQGRLALIMSSTICTWTFFQQLCFCF